MNKFLDNLKGILKDCWKPFVLFYIAVFYYFLLMECLLYYTVFMTNAGLDLSMYITALIDLYVYQVMVFVVIFNMVHFVLCSPKYSWSYTAIFLGSFFHFIHFVFYTIDIWRGEAELAFDFENDYIYKIHLLIVSALLVQYLIVNRKRWKEGYKRYKEIKERRKADEMSIVR